ncbi:aminopeptidase P family N-terminal domain-containing protein [Candidatus Micrarchaeota archaeon]|nr:aminopeptidase P family N-terminal domain-containing protein [Candidatus Micrarchaeota archaeon]
MNTLLFRGNEFDANFFYFSKIDVDNSFYLNLNGKRMLFVPKLNERAAKSSFNGQVIVYKKPLEEIAKLLKAKKMKLDYSALPAKIYEKLRRVCKPTDSSS